MLAVSVALVGCKKNPAPAPPTPPTPAEAETFAKEYASARVPCDLPKLEALVDLDLILARAVQGLDLSRAMVKGIRSGMRPADILCPKATGDNQTIRYLRTQTIDATPRPLFRLLGDEGITYEQLELDRRGTRVVVADLYNWASGSPHSQMFRNLIVAMTDAGGDTELTGLRKLRDEKLFPAAYERLRALPAELRATKEMMLFEVGIAMNMDDETAMASMDRYMKAFPGDPSLLINVITLHGLHKRHAEQLAAIDVLDRAIRWRSLSRGAARRGLSGAGQARRRTRGGSSRDRTRADDGGRILGAAHGPGHEPFVR